MPGTEHALVADPAWIVTCEHASRRLPSRYGTLGLTPAQLISHVAWDPGAAAVARALARRLRCPLHMGKYSRLLVDLNRGEHHPKLIPRQAFGLDVPGNCDIEASERHYRLERYWRPYRDGVTDAMRRLIACGAPLVHWSVHSFTPNLHGVERRADVGLLYDPGRTLERELVSGTVLRLRQAGFHVRRNYPYRGVSDGLTRHCRTLLPDHAYAGIEIELNQRLTASSYDILHLTRRLTAALLG